MLRGLPARFFDFFAREPSPSASTETLCSTIARLRNAEYASGSHFGQYQSPSGTLNAGGSRHPMWYSSSQLSQIRIVPAEASRLHTAHTRDQSLEHRFASRSDAGRRRGSHRSNAAFQYCRIFIRRRCAIKVQRKQRRQSGQWPGQGIQRPAGYKCKRQLVRGQNHHPGNSLTEVMAAERQPAMTYSSLCFVTLRRVERFHSSDHTSMGSYCLRRRVNGMSFCCLKRTCLSCSSDRQRRAGQNGCPVTFATPRSIFERDRFRHLERQPCWCTGGPDKDGPSEFRQRQV